MKNMTVQANGSFALIAPDYIDVAFMSASSERTHTPPVNASHVVFAGNADFYVRYNATASVPGAHVTDGTGSELNPTARHLSGVTTIHLISASDCTVTMAFYQG